MACRNQMMMPHSDHIIRLPKSPLDVDHLGRTSVRCCLNISWDKEGSIGRIREMLNKVGLSTPAYETAGMAIVPVSREYPNRPCSWGTSQPKHLLLVKNSLSSTLARLLALRKWRRGRTVHTMDVFLWLQIIDTLEKLGLDRYFRNEIEKQIDEIYRSWQQKNKEIFSDATCCAMAFRLLRLGGYDVSSDELVGFVDQEHFFSVVSPMFTIVTSILELYKASQLIIYPNEETLVKIHSWTGTYLKHQLLNQSILNKKFHKEVESTVKNYHGTLARVLNRQCIELYGIDKFQILKTVFRGFNISNIDLLNFAMQDFNVCQALHQTELQKLERWYEENELQSSRVPKRNLYSSYFMITADVFEPELSEARIAYAQTCVLIVVVDDLFDNCASREELVDLIELVKKWDKNSFTSCSSKQVKVFLLALYNTIDELAEKAFLHQGRCIKQHLISMWQELLEGMMIELDWWGEKLTPTMDEYLSIGRTTIGSKICTLTGLYFLGPNLSEDILNSEETKSLSYSLSTVARLLNDIQTLEKELLERKPNSVSIQVARGHGAITMKEAREKIEEMIESSRRQLLAMVVKSKGSLVPRVCKDLFWTTSKICFYLYKFTNEYDSPKEMVNDTKRIIYEPVKFPTNII